MSDVTKRPYRPAAVRRAETGRHPRRRMARVLLQPDRRANRAAARPRSRINSCSPTPRAERPALYFTVLGEPTIKMLRYQQQFTFFDMREGEYGRPFREPHRRGAHERSAAGPRRDRREGRRAVRRGSSSWIPSARSAADAARRRGWRCRNSCSASRCKLTSWQATTFLLGEYPEAEIRDNPVFTMADGLITMTQRVDRNSMVRQVHVSKMRGNSPQPGLHTIRISERRRPGVPAHAQADRGSAGRPSRPS